VDVGPDRVKDYIGFHTLGGCYITDYTKFYESRDGENWSDLMSAVVRYSIMGWGMGCWPRIALMLREFDVTPA
jgi:hypothetical protein